MCKWKRNTVINKDKYQLSLTDPRDCIVLETELDELVERRSSDVLST